MLEWLILPLLLRAGPATAQDGARAVEFIADRCESVDAPENTMPAFRRAWEWHVLTLVRLGMGGIITDQPASLREELRAEGGVR